MRPLGWRKMDMGGGGDPLVSGSECLKQGISTQYKLRGE